MAKRIPDVDGMAAVTAALAADASRPDRALAVRYTLQCLAERAPGQQWLIKQFAISGDAVAKSYEFRLACEPLALNPPNPPTPA